MQPPRNAEKYVRDFDKAYLDTVDRRREKIPYDTKPVITDDLHDIYSRATEHMRPHPVGIDATIAGQAAALLRLMGAEIPGEQAEVPGEQAEVPGEQVENPSEPIE